MTDKRAYFKVDVGYFTNPKIAAVLVESPTAIVLHLESIAYAAQHLTDGIVPSKLVQRLVGATDEDADILTSSGLWRAVDRGRIEVHDYLEHQRSSAEAKKLSDAGRKGAVTRWKSEPDADRNADGNADRNADGNAISMRTPMAREKEREKDTKAADADFDTFWATYPKRVGKGAAVKAWKSARAKAEPAQIIAGVKAALPKWTGTEARFIPNPATWLNQERWTDEPAPTVAAAQPGRWW